MDLKSQKENPEADSDNSAEVVCSLPKTPPTSPTGTFGLQNSTRFGIFSDLQAVRQNRSEQLFRKAKSAGPACARRSMVARLCSVVRETADSWRSHSLRGLIK